MQLHLTQLGTPKQIQTSRGQAEKNYCKATEYGDKFLNYWVNGYTKNWKVGDVVEIEKVEERQYTNKEGQLATSYDIKLPNREDRVPKWAEELLNRQSKQHLEVMNAFREVYKVLKPTPSKVDSTDLDYPEPEIDPSEVTFDPDEK